MQADISLGLTYDYELGDFDDAASYAISIACACQDHTHTVSFWHSLSENHRHIIIALKPFSVGGKRISSRCGRLANQGSHSR